MTHMTIEFARANGIPSWRLLQVANQNEARADKTGDRRLTDQAATLRGIGNDLAREEAA